MQDYSKIRISEICRIVKIDIKGGNSKEILDRSSEGVIVVLEGSLEYVHNNRVFVSDPNRILIVPKGISYRFKSITDSTSIVINFNLQEPLQEDTFISIKLEHSDFAVKMEKLWTFKKEGYHLSCLSKLYGFFAQLCIDTTFFPTAKQKMIQPGIAYMEEHILDNSLRDDDIAKVCGISKTYFRNLFIKKYGMPPMKFIRIQKIERAKQVFDSGYFTSVGDVAMDSGFSDIYTFSKVFKKETGMTPSEYIQLAK